MKKLLLSFLILFSFAVSCGSHEQNLQQQSVSKPIDKTETVYICTGGYSKRYHSTASCRGLNRCKGDIIDVSLEDAKSRGRTPCKICY